MVTLREFILNQSTMPLGTTIRVHIENPVDGDHISLVDGLDVEITMSEILVNNTSISYDVEI